MFYARIKFKAMDIKEVELITSKISSIDPERKQVVLNHLKMFRYKQAIAEIQNALEHPVFC